MTDAVSYTRLPNGVQVLTEEIPHVRSATVGIWVTVGSMHEPAELAGICHALEHMLFKGTQTRTARDISQVLDTVGGQLNAFTDKEVTCFHAKVLSEHLGMAVDLLCDMLRQSLLRAEDLRCEKRVILEEIRQLEDEPDELVQEILLELIWQDHPLGRPVIGSRRSVRALKCEVLAQFLQSHYTANRILVATAGNVRHDEILAQVAALLGDLEPAADTIAIPPPAFTRNVRRVARDTEQAHLCLGMPGYSQLETARYPLSVLDTILGGTSSSRLFQEVREKRGLAYTIGSGMLAYRDAGWLSVYVGTNPESVDKVMRLIRDELDRIVQDGVTDLEVEQARSQLKGSMLLALEGTGSRMARIAKSQHYYGRVVPLEEVVRDLDRVTTEDVNRVARAVLTESSTAQVLLGPATRPTARRQK